MTTPLPAGTATGAGSTPIDQSVVQAITGVIRRPRTTFRLVVTHPRWGTLLLVTTVLSALAGAAFMETAVGRQALVDQWERTAAAFGQPIDDAGYEQLQALSDRAAGAYAVAGALISGPVLTLGIAGLLRVAFRNHVTFQQTLAVAAHAGVILALRQVLAAPIGYVQETTSSAMNLGTLFSSLDEASAVSRFLAALNGFYAKVVDTHEL